MTGTLVVNNLAGLMMFTSLLVTCARRYTVSCWLYALQSLVLVSIFLPSHNCWMQNNCGCGPSAPSLPRF